MTERQKDTTPSPDQQPEKPLSTADMAAVEERRQSEASEIKRIQEDGVPPPDAAERTRAAERSVQLLAERSATSGCRRGAPSSTVSSS